MRFSQTKPRIRLLIFDLDGTLVDSKTDLALSVNATLRHLGRPPLEDETIYSYVGRGAEALIARAVGDGVTSDEMKRGLRYFINYYWQHKLDNTTLYPGVRESLDRLANIRTANAQMADGRAGNSRGDRVQRILAVLTNKPVYPSQGIIDDLGLGQMFRFVYGGNSFTSKKPDSVGVHALLRETGVAPREAMIVGDSDVDIETGVRAGVWTCGVTYGFGNLDIESNPPDVVVDSLSELADALDGAP